MGASAAVSRSPAPASTQAAPPRAEQSPRLRALPWALGALLGLAAALWPLLALPAAGFCLLGALALPSKAAPGASWSRRWLVLGVLGASLGLWRFVVEEAMPGIVRGGRDAVEQRAVSRLRDVLFAEDALRKAGWIDPDADGIGSAALLSELCGGPPARGQPERPNGVLTCGELVETPVGLAAQLAGYLFVVCVPGKDGRWLGRAGAPGGHPSAGQIDEEAAERHFVAYAWPEAAHFERAFYLDQDENIRTALLPAGADSARTSALSCDAALGSAGAPNWVAWRDKRPRPGPLPGDSPRVIAAQQPQR